MLTGLSIRDFVLVRALDLDLGGGFSALTGETGAGKSILMSALGFSLGARGGQGLIRPGRSIYRVQATRVAKSSRSSATTTSSCSSTIALLWIWAEFTPRRQPRSTSTRRRRI